MGATVKTLLDNQGELFWGTYHDDPDYHYGMSLEYVDNVLVALSVYVMTDVDDDEALVTPELLAECYTVADLEARNIVISDRMEDEESDAIGWYCIEGISFDMNELPALRASSEGLENYLATALEILDIGPDGIEERGEALEEISFFDMQRQLEVIGELIDTGKLKKPLPFEFRLIGEALLGWEFADEADFR